MLIVHFLSPVEMDRKLWGYWSRSNGLITSLSLILISLSFFIFAKNQNFIISTLFTIELFACLTATYGVFQKFGLDPFAWSVSNQVFGTFGNTNFASAVWSLGAMTSFSLLLMTWGLKKQRWMHISLTTVLLIVIYWTNSIQGLIAFGLFLAFCIFIFAKRKGVKFLVAYLVFAVSSAVVVVPSMFGVGLIGSALEQYTLKLRSLYWLAGIKMGNSSPVIGIGVDSYGDYYRNFRSLETAKLTSIDLVTNNAHNTFIQSYATLGILGLSSVVLLFITSLYRASKILFNRESTFENELIAAIFIVLWLLACISIDNIAIAVWNWLFLGLVIGTNIVQREIQVPQTNPKSKKSMSKELGTLSPLKYLSLALCAACFAFSWGSSQSDRELISTFNTPTFADNQASLDKRANDLLRIVRNPIAQEGHYLYVAKGLIAINRHSEAIAVLESGLRRYPRDFVLLSLMSQEQIDFGSTNDAIKYLEKMTILDQRRAATWLNLAFMYSRNNDFALSRNAARRAYQFAEFLDENGKTALESLTTNLRENP